MEEPLLTLRTTGASYLLRRVSAAEAYGPVRFDIPWSCGGAIPVAPLGAAGPALLGDRRAMRDAVDSEVREVPTGMLRKCDLRFAGIVLR